MHMKANHGRRKPIIPLIGRVSVYYATALGRGFERRVAWLQLKRSVRKTRVPLFFTNHSLESRSSESWVHYVLLSIRLLLLFH